MFCAQKILLNLLLLKNYFYANSAKFTSLSNRMRILSFAIVFLCLRGNLFSQTIPTSGQRTGTIEDTQGGPLSNAYLFLKSYPEFNWTSNSSGNFELRFPEVLKNDTLVISLLGYHRKQVPLARLNPTGNLINLEEALISLNEVIVTPVDNSLKEMIFKAIDNIPKNYPDKRHQLTGLYRKVSTNYEEFTHLVEAAVVVEDLGYGKDVRRAKVKMEALRQSDEHAEVDPYITQLKSRTRQQIIDMGEPVGPLNPIIGTYPSDIRAAAYVPKSNFGKEGYRFMGIPELPTYHRFVGTEVIGADTIYHIAIGGVDPPTGSSYLKINGRNHAIFEYQLDYLFGLGHVYVKFREVGGHYYPEIIRQKSLRLINRDVGIHQMDIHTLWFDEVNTDQLEKIKPRELLKKDQTLDPNLFSLDEHFWEESTLLKTTRWMMRSLKVWKRNDRCKNNLIGMQKTDLLFDFRPQWQADTSTCGRA